MSESRELCAACRRGHYKPDGTCPTCGAVRPEPEAPAGEWVEKVSPEGVAAARAQLRAARPPWVDEDGHDG